MKNMNPNNNDDSYSNKSMHDKMLVIYNLCCDIDRSGIPESASEKEKDRLWSWLDGLAQQYIIYTIEGRCSLGRTLACGMEEIENDLDEDYKLFKALEEKSHLEKQQDEH